MLDILTAVGGTKFGEGVAHVVDERLHEVAQERLVHVHVLPAVAYRAAEDAAEDVAASFVAGQRTVGDGEGQTAQVIGDDAVGDVDHDLVVRNPPLPPLGKGGKMLPLGNGGKMIL